MCVTCPPACRHPLIGFKGIPSGDVGVNAATLKSKQETEAAAITSGMYTWYQVRYLIQEIYGRCYAAVLDLFIMYGTSWQCPGRCACLGILVKLRLKCCNRVQLGPFLPAGCVVPV